MWTIHGYNSFEDGQKVGRECCPPLPQALSIEGKTLIGPGIPNPDQLQAWHEDANSSMEYKDLTSATFAAAPKWLSERKVKARWTLLSESSDLERQSSICIRVKQIRAAISPLADVSPRTQDLLGLVNEIQKLHSPQLQEFKFCEIRLLGYTNEHDKLQAMITLKRTKRRGNGPRPDHRA